MSADLVLHPFRAGTIAHDDESRALLKILGTSGSERDFSSFAETLVAALAGDLASPGKDDVSPLDHVRKLPFFASLGSKGEPAAKALIASLIDFARCNSLSSSVVSSLEELGLSGPRAKAITTLFVPAIPRVRQRLTAGGSVLPRVVDLKWRLDYLLSSKDGGKIGSPIFFVDLLLQDASTGLDLPRQQFTCTPPELEDLRLKIRDAMRAAQALATVAAGGRASS